MSRQNSSRRKEKRCKRCDQCSPSSSENQNESSQPAEVAEVSSETTTTNDPAWYAHDPQLLADASSMPYSDPLGKVLQCFDMHNGNHYSYTAPTFSVTWASSAYQFALPGIVALYTFPTLGGASKSEDAVNVAAHMLYTNVRYNSSGRKNYDQSDLMMYCLAVSDMYSYIMWMRRAYNAAFMASQRNLYMTHLLQAMDMNESLSSDLANFRSWINLFISKVSTLVVPASIELFKRRAFLYSNVYTESEDGSIQDQLYMFNPSAFLKFGYDSSGAGCLTPVLLPTDHKLTLDDIMSIGNSLLSNVMGNEDFSIMAGDLMRTYPDSRIGIESQPSEGIIIPIYDYYVLSQFKNANVISDFVVGSNTIVNHNVYRTQTPDGYHANIPTVEISASLLDPSTKKTVYAGGVYQDGSGLLVNPLFTYVLCDDYSKTGAHVGGKPNLSNVHLLSSDSHIVSSMRGDTSPAFTVEATRLSATIDAPEQIDSYIKDDDPNSTLGTDYVSRIHSNAEVAVGIKVYRYSNILDSTGNMKFECNSSVLKDNAIVRKGYNFPVDIAFYMNMMDLTHWYSLKYLPMQWMIVCNDTNNHKLGDISVYYTELASEIGMYTVQSSANIRRLNDVAMLSLLATPGVSKILN